MFYPWAMFFPIIIKLNGMKKYAPSLITQFWRKKLYASKYEFNKLSCHDIFF